MTLPSVLTLAFWINTNPGAFIPFLDRAVLILMAVFVLAGIGAYVYRVKGLKDKFDRQTAAKVGSLLVTTGLIGLMLYAFQYEGVPYLSMRLWWVVLAVWFVWTGWTLSRFALKTIPEIREAQAERAQFEKWLPKKKK